MVSLSTIVAVDAFDADNGGTEAVPGSHRWDDAALAGAYDLRDDESAQRAAATDAFAAQARAIEMPAGGCVVFAGTLLHRGGRNRSGAARAAFSHQYCQPWGRQQENFTLAVPAEVAREMPSRLQELLGFSIHPPFMGQLSASHPRKALAAGHVLPVVAQARTAGARLPE
jgi:ectoine hydroxylase-related dioxygenase (phytanoyl-CoA dioxygenase family)